MNFSRFILLVSFLLAADYTVCSAQRDVDSLESLLQKPDLSEIERIDALNLLCQKFLYVSFDRGLDYGTRALNLSIARGYAKGEARAYRNLAGVYSSTGDFVICVKYVKRALSIFEQDRDSIGIANCYITLGHIYRKQNSRSQEIFYHKKSYEVFSRFNIPDRIGVSAHNLGESYFNNQEYGMARIYTNIAIKSNLAVQNLPVLSSCYNVLGRINYYSGNLDEAADNFSKVLEISNQLGENSQKVALTQSLLYLSYIYKKRNQSEKQIATLARVLKLSKEYNLDDFIRTTYFEIISYFLQRNDTKKANEYLNEYSVALNSIIDYQHQQTEKLTQAMMSGIDSEKERERLDQEQHLQSKLLKARNMQLIIAASALLSLGVLVFIIVRINNKLKVSLAHLNDQAVFRNKIYSVLIHDLKSPMRFILSNLRVLYYSFEKENNQMTPLVYDLLQSTSNAYRFMDEFHGWIVRSENITVERELISLQDLLAELVEFYAPLAAHRGNSLILPESEEVIVRVKIHSLKIVLRNLIDNALKNTKDGQITLSVFSGVNYLNIAVQDTGGGFNNDILSAILVTVNGEIMKEIIPKFNGGLGFNIIAEFLKSENALICIESEQGIGTKIILSLPKH